AVALACGSTHQLGREALDDIALDEVVDRRQPDAALEAGRDLADVVADPAQRLDPIRGHDLAASPDPGAAANDPPIGHVAAGNDRRLADLEDLTDLGPPFDDLDELGLEEAVEC